VTRKPVPAQQSLQDAGLKAALSCSLALPCKHHLNPNRAALLSHRAWGCLANASGIVSKNRRENDRGQKKTCKRDKVVDKEKTKQTYVGILGTSQQSF